MKHHFTHADEVKGGEHSHSHHKSQHDHHMKQAQHHAKELHKLAKHGHKVPSMRPKGSHRVK